jgi:ribonuclease Z
VPRDTARVTVDTAKLATLGLRPGPWLQRVRGPRASDTETIDVGGTPRRLVDLQDALLRTTTGESVAYLTDFRLDASAEEQLTEVLRGVTTVVCESQYRDADLDLARRNYHLTATQAATVARRAGVGRLVLFHVSDRYRPVEWWELLTEAQAIFPATMFPDHWEFPSGAPA